MSRFWLIAIVIYVILGVLFVIRVQYAHSAPWTQPYKWFAGDMDYAQWETMSTPDKMELGDYYTRKFYKADKYCTMAQFSVYCEQDRARFYVECVQWDWQTRQINLKEN